MPHAASRTRIASGLGPTAQAGDDARVVARAGRGVADLRRRRRGRPAARSRWPRPAAAAASGAPKQRRHLARDADVRQRVGAVRRDVDLQHLVEQPDVAGQIGARAARQATESRFRHLPRRCPSSTSLHSMPGDDTPRTSLRLQLAAARQRARRAAPRRPCRRRPGRSARRTRPRPRRLRPARDDAHQRSFSALGCGRVPQHLGDHARRATSRPRRSIDSTSSPTSVSCCATLSAVTPGLSVDELAQPVERDLHRNCARKRTSCS